MDILYSRYWRKKTRKQQSRWYFALEIVIPMLFCRAKLRVDFVYAVRDMTYEADGRRPKDLGQTYIKSFKLALKGRSSYPSRLY